VQGEGDEAALNLGEWFQYQLDIDLPLLALPYEEKSLLLDISTQNAIQGMDDQGYIGIQ